jgi:hypothetical protein
VSRAPSPGRTGGSPPGQDDAEDPFGGMAHEGKRCGQSVGGNPPPRNSSDSRAPPRVIEARAPARTCLNTSHVRHHFHLNHKQEGASVGHEGAPAISQGWIGAGLAQVFILFHIAPPISHRDNLVSRLRCSMTKLCRRIRDSGTPLFVLATLALLPGDALAQRGGRGGGPPRAAVRAVLSRVRVGGRAQDPLQKPVLARAGKGCHSSVKKPSLRSRTRGSPS